MRILIIFLNLIIAGFVFILICTIFIATDFSEWDSVLFVLSGWIIMAFLPALSSVISLILLPSNRFAKFFRIFAITTNVFTLIFWLILSIFLGPFSFVICLIPYLTILTLHKHSIEKSSALSKQID